MGGPGGRGGDGGGGGHGGGGGGGPSIGIECAGASALAVDVGNEYEAGSSGRGGASSGNTGADGLEADTHGC
jgi:hypothetical protein